MRSKKTKLLAVSFALLTAISALLVFVSKEDTRQDIDKELFRINTDKISDVVLETPSGKVELKFENNQWKVNDKWAADARMIKVLFATLMQVEPARPVALSLKDSLKTLLEQKGTRVLFPGNEKDNFYFLGNEAKTETWFMKANDPQPYVMVIPGYRVYVGGILELNESGWRNKRIFDFSWRNFKSLSSVYTKDSKQNFELQMQNGVFGVKGLANSDTTKVNDYLDALSYMVATRFVSADKPPADSLINTLPVIKIEIRDIANRSYTLDLYAPRINDTEVFGKLGDGQVVAIDRNDASVAVRPRDFFVKRPSQ